MSQHPRLFRNALILCSAAVLSACASGPSGNISLIPAETAAQAGKSGAFTQPLKWDHKKPGCTGDCPEIKVDSLIFPGRQKLTELVDYALATMTGVSSNQPPPYSTLAEFEAYFWKTAAPRDSVSFTARVRYSNKNLTVIELGSWQYYTGAAHGISATQFLNWDNASAKVLGLDNILLPGKRDAYVAALKQAHTQWLASNPDAKHDPATYNRLWPFKPSDNFGFTDHGLIVKYNSYEIAPYSSGQPELLIPFGALHGILKPEYLPA